VSHLHRREDLSARKNAAEQVGNSVYREGVVKRVEELLSRR
jgi:hypothetical protein